MGVRPIRKIGPSRVGLTSYDGKTFIDRVSKKADSYLEYVVKRLNKATIEPTDYLLDVAPGNVFDNYFEAPYIYCALAERFRSFKAGVYLFNFNHKERIAAASPELLAKLEEGGRRLVGQTTTRKPLVVDADNNFFVVDDGVDTKVGDIFDILQLDRTAAPVDFCEVKIYSKPVPVGVFIAYNLGFRKLVKYLKAKHRLVEGKQQKKLQPFEYAVQFKDVSYIFDRRDVKASLILAGFRVFDKEIKNYDAIDFDNKDVYFKLLESKGLTSIYLSEMETLNELFIDPITEGILKSLGEPQTFMGLLVRAAEMLVTYNHPSSQDMDNQRIRGYERFAGVMYKQLSTSIRSFKNKNRTGRAKVDMSPYQVWQTIMKDSSVKLAEDINPIQSLKASESLTYVGDGGRSKESMNKESRAYHQTNMGVVSEASVDSSDVGINSFLSASPDLANARGLSAKKRSITPSSLLSTSVLLAPFSNHDDQKRVAFVSIQQAHTIATVGYHAPVVRTGYESVIGQRTGEMFASTAKLDGKVISKTPNGILVEYEDGSRKGLTLGTIHGKAEGSVYPHNLVSDMVEGQKFSKGDYLSYNTGFFVKDPISPGSIVYKGSAMTRVAMLETPHTLEDSSAISVSLAEKMAAVTTKIKSYSVGFKQNVLNVVKQGHPVNPEDVLMTIEDEITSMDDSFGSSSIDILTNLAKMSPRSGYKGTVTWIEVLYHGDKTDMSSSLKALADKSDKRKADIAKSTGRPVIHGAVNSDYRVQGIPLSVDRAELRVHIDVIQPSGNGDKFVFGNQIKSVCGEVMPYTMTTESGLVVDVKFGAKSYAARIVSSLIEIGVRASTLEVITKTAIKAYRGN